MPCKYTGMPPLVDTASYMMISWPELCIMPHSLSNKCLLANKSCRYHWCICILKRPYLCHRVVWLCDDNGLSLTFQAFWGYSIADVPATSCDIHKGRLCDMTLQQYNAIFSEKFLRARMYSQLQTILEDNSQPVIADSEHTMFQDH